MKILDVIWLDDEKNEGSLTLSTGRSFFQTYCYPCSFQKGDVIVLPLQSFDDRAVVKVEGYNYDIEPVGKSFECRITARVEDVKKGLLSVGHIKIELSCDLPGDINEGDTVTFASLRLQARKA